MTAWQIHVLNEGRKSACYYLYSEDGHEEGHKTAGDHKEGQHVIVYVQKTAGGPEENTRRQDITRKVGLLLSMFRRP